MSEGFVVPREGACFQLESVHSDGQMATASVGKHIDGYGIASAL